MIILYIFGVGLIILFNIRYYYLRELTVIKKVSKIIQA